MFLVLISRFVLCVLFPNSIENVHIIAHKIYPVALVCHYSINYYKIKKKWKSTSGNHISICDLKFVQKNIKIKLWLCTWFERTNSNNKKKRRNRQILQAKLKRRKYEKHANTSAKLSFGGRTGVESALQTQNKLPISWIIIIIRFDALSRTSFSLSLFFLSKLNRTIIIYFNKSIRQTLN